jgi:hypothetical protein
VSGESAVGPWRSPQGGPGPTTKLSTVCDLYEHEAPIPGALFYSSQVAERPQLSVQSPIQILEAFAGEGGTNQGASDHGFFERRDVRAGADGQPVVPVSIPGDGAYSARRDCLANISRESHESGFFL